MAVKLPNVNNKIKLSDFFVDLLRNRTSTSEKKIIEENVAKDFLLKESSKPASYQKDIMDVNRENKESIESQISIENKVK